MPPLQPIGWRLLEFARGQLESAEEQLASEGDDRHTGIHQARKSLRRARAVLALGESAFDHHAAVLDEGLRRLCHGLSPIRDAQALITALQRLRDENPEVRAILPEALAAAKHRRDELLAGYLDRDPAMRSRRQRIMAFHERIAKLDWDSVDEDVVRTALERSERRVAKANEGAEQRKDDNEAWHRFRRRLRRLHQQHTLLDDLAPDLHVKAHKLEKRADALGEAQDDVLLLARCRGHSPFEPAHRQILRKVARKRLKDARKSAGA